jgi:predicted DsbA family dithiol-disulfide isomerase
MRVHLDIWSDYVCPFCFLMVPALAHLREQFHGVVTIAWRAYELRPDPVPTLDPDGEYLRDVWSQAVYPHAAELGIDVQLPTLQPRSRLAHEAAAFARAHGCFEAMHQALFEAFFQRSEDIGKSSVLIAIGTRVGLDPHALANALHHRTHRDAVLAEEEQAAELGLTAVPATVIHRAGDPPEMALKLLGTQSPTHLRDLVAQLAHP